MSVEALFSIFGESLALFIIIYPYLAFWRGPVVRGLLRVP